MPRAIWSGSIAFGLVNAPVRMYAAIDEHDLDLHLVHATDGSRIGYQKICKAEGRPVSDDEIAKAFELDGELVLLEPEDFEAAETESTKTIEILAFAPYEDVDPIYFERSFYLGPQDGGEKVYALLVEAMERSGLAGVVRFVFHEREHIGLLRVRGAALVLARLHFADEIRPVESIRPDRQPQVDERELEMALSLIERFRGEFDPSAYEDRYRERLLEVIERKRRGGTTKPAPTAAPEETPDLLTALKESLERAGRNGEPAAEGRSDLAELTMDELTKRARKLDITGRSKMTKRELVSALEESGGR